jgi:hypothetical protein
MPLMPLLALGTDYISECDLCIHTWTEDESVETLQPPIKSGFFIRFGEGGEKPAAC